VITLPAAGLLPDLQVIWKNCASQSIQFVFGGPLKVTTSTYGQMQVLNGTIMGGDNTMLAIQAAYTGCTANGYAIAGFSQCQTSVGPASEVTVLLPIVLPGSSSPNAVVISISGSLSATDPRTHQAISLPFSFSA
jgi:hypothetical protein